MGQGAWGMGGPIRQPAERGQIVGREQGAMSMGHGAWGMGTPKG